MRMFWGTPSLCFWTFQHLASRGTLDSSYSRIKYVEICDHLNRYIHLNYQPEFNPITSSRYYSLSNWEEKTTRSNRMKFRLLNYSNKWFLEWIPCIFVSEYGRSNAAKVKIRSERTRPSHLRLLSHAALAWLLATSLTGELARRLPQLVTLNYSLFQEALSCAFSSWLLNMWDPITAPWLAPLLGTFGLGLLCW